MKAGKSEGPNNERTKLKEKLEPAVEESSETAEGGNCGHPCGPAKQSPGDEVAASNASQVARPRALRNSTQKAMYETDAIRSCVSHVMEPLR